MPNPQILTLKPRPYRNSTKQPSAASLTGARRPYPQYSHPQRLTSRVSANRLLWGFADSEVLLWEYSIQVFSRGIGSFMISGRDRTSWYQCTCRVGGVPLVAASLAVNLRYTARPTPQLGAFTAKAPNTPEPETLTSLNHKRALNPNARKA